MCTDITSATSFAQHAEQSTPDYAVSDGNPLTEGLLDSLGELLIGKNAVVP